MTPQLWIGFGFAALLVVFLIYSVIWPPKADDTTRATIKFLTALCAGFAGGFITGDALFRMSGTVGGTEILVSGAAGCALFFAVWFFYPQVFRLRDGFTFSIPAGWTFRQAADTMAQTVNHLVDYDGFADTHLAAAMAAKTISSESVREAIANLRLAATTPEMLPKYEVEERGSVFHLKVQG